MNTSNRDTRMVFLSHVSVSEPLNMTFVNMCNRSRSKRTVFIHCESFPCGFSKLIRLNTNSCRWNMNMFYLHDELIHVSLIGNFGNMNSCRRYIKIWWVLEQVRVAWLPCLTGVFDFFLLFLIFTQMCSRKKNFLHYRYN